MTTEKEKQQARRKVSLAIKRGDLARPSICSRCGMNPGPAIDGRAQIHGHHDDYSKPLTVEWICAKCHRAETPLPDVMGAPTPGIRNGMAKLNDESVLFIRSSDLSSRALAKIFDVDHKTILRAKNRELWRHVLDTDSDGENHDSLR